MQSAVPWSRSQLHAKLRNPPGRSPVIWCWREKAYPLFETPFLRLGAPTHGGGVWPSNHLGSQAQAGWEPEPDIERTLPISSIRARDLTP
jgi:hypothetical protein